MSHTDEIKIAYQWYRLLEWKRRKELNTKYGCSDDNITNDVVLEIYNAEHYKAHKPTEDKELFTQGEWDNNLNDGNVLSGGIVVANCYSSLLMPATIKANARLISSTPDLYNALKSLYEAREMGGTSVMDWEILFDTAKLALDKAIGK